MANGMSAIMLIEIRVQAAQAQRELSKVRAQEASLGTQMASVERNARKMTYGLPALSKWGNQVQWAGRQLQYNFTLPLALAGAAATKFELNNEKAFTRIVKVYGDGTRGAQFYRKEIDSLRGAFRALSDEFGVNQAEVINIAADWAAAGASGLALAKSTKLTLETMILGEMNAADATSALIAIQAQFGQSTGQLSRTIDTLNMVENQTGISMEGLIQGFQRSAGVARSTGVDVRHLAALLAALVPSSGSAANAGNALKTVFSRLLAPTKEASQVLGLMGIKMDSVNWKSLTASQRIELMAKKYVGLSSGLKSHTKELDHTGKATGRMISSQQAVVSSVVASRWQINRWDVLMRDVANRHGYYQKALNATIKPMDNFRQKQFELNQVLSSNPQRLKQMWVILQNAMADVIQPLIPYIVYLAQTVARMANAFSNMNPYVQKTILFGLALLAVIGPLARYIGSVTLLGGLLASTLHFVAARMGLVAVETVAANGAITMQRGGLLGLIGTWMKFLLMPFRAVFGLIAAGFGLIPGAVALAVRGVGLFFRAMWGVRLLPAMMLASTRGFIAIWRGTFAGLRALAIVFWAQMRLITLAGMLGELSIMGRILASMSALWSLFSFGLANIAIAGSQSLILIWSGFATVFRGIWLGIEAVALVGSATMWTRLSRLWSYGAVLLRTLWVTFLAQMRLISVAFSIGEVGIFATMWRGLALVSNAGFTAIFGIFSLLKQSVFILARGMTTGLLRAGPAILAALRVGFMGFITFLRANPISLAITAALAAALAVAYHFRDKIAQAWNAIPSAFANAMNGTLSFLQPLVNGFNNAVSYIVRAFWALPEGIRGALIATVNIVRNAALEVYSWFSWLNPWAHHSPSLVENVTSGMDAVQKQFARARGIGSIFSRAASDLQKFGVIANKMKVADATKNAKGSGPLAQALLGDYKRLLPILNAQEAAVNKQQAVVDKWSAALDKANNKLDTQQNILDGLQSKLDALNATYQAHQDALQNWAETPIKGEQAMSDAIFENGQAQKAVQLQMLQWQQVNGTLDSVTNKINDMNGAMELLRGEQSGLRTAGAGSEITGPLQAQIDGIQGQADALKQVAANSPLPELQKQLDDLNLQGQILDLQNSLDFDPLHRQIDQLVNSMQEMPFDQIIAGAQQERDAMNKMQPSIDAATAAVRQQQTVVDGLKASRDALQASYDRESKSLDNLNNKYQKTQDLVNGIEQALGQMASARDAANAADDAKKHKGLKGQKGAKGKKPPKPPALTPGAQSFLDAKGGGFPDPGSLSKIGREGGLKDQSKLIDDFTKQEAKKVGEAFGHLDIFGGLKSSWKRVWGWIKSNVTPAAGSVLDGVAGFRDRFRKIIDDVKNGFKFGRSGGPGGIGDVFGKAMGPAFRFGQVARKQFDRVSGGVKFLWKWGKKIGKLFGPDLRRIWKALTDAGKDIWNLIGPELERFIPLGKDLWLAFRNVASIVGPVLVAAIKILASIFSTVLGPILHWVIKIIANLIQVFRGVVEVIVGLLSGDLKTALHGFYDIFAGTFGAIGSLIMGALQGVWDIIKGFFVGIWEIAKWLWKELVGHSIIPDIVNGIWKWMKKLGKLGQWVWDHSFGVVVKMAKKLWNIVKAVFKFWWTGIRREWGALKKLGQWIWDNVLVKVRNFVRNLWSNHVKPELAKWWARIKAIWATMKRLGQWIWDNVFVRVVNKAKSLWSDHVKPELGKWYARVKSVWNSLTNLGAWVKQHVMDPVVSKIKSAWTGLKNWLTNNKGMLTAPVHGIVNAVIRGVDALIRGLNKVSDVLPGIKFHINPIAELAQGGPVPGSRARNGFKTHGARAIVGEGRRNHPEYVIPTDPAYRKRAHMLYKQAGQQLGIDAGAAKTGAWGESFNDVKKKVTRGGVPLYADGGVLGKIGGGITSGWGTVKDMAKGAASWIKGNIRKLASTPFKAFKALAKSIIGKVGWAPARGLGNYGVNKATDWITGADAEMYHKAKQVKDQQAANQAAASAGGGHWSGHYSTNERIARAQRFARSQVGKPYIWGGVGPGGYDCSGFMSAITNVLRGSSPYHRVGATASFPWGGFAPGPGKFTIGSANPFPGSGVGHMAGTLGGMPVESYGGHGPAIGHRGAYSAGFNKHAHLVGLRAGGIIRAKHGGTLFRAGEGTNDEAVVPLPRNWRKDVGSGVGNNGKTVNIYISGNLEFPNITDPNDAATFIENLEILAKD